MTTNRSRPLLALVAAVALLGAACSSDSDPATSAGAGDGDGGAQAVSFATVDLDGASVDSASLAGTDTVLWFWAPWCTVCRAEGPGVAEAAAQLGDDVQVIGVAGRGEVPEMQAFVDATGTEGIQHLVDEDGSIWRGYGVTSQPAFAFIDASGEVVDVQVGALGEDALIERAEALSAS